jgi:acetyltransferase-like isoleucine patch superfamily enzyme
MIGLKRGFCCNSGNSKKMFHCTDKENMGKIDPRNFKTIDKNCLHDELHGSALSVFARYKKKVLGGKASFFQLIKYELASLFCMNIGGGAGYLIRRLIFPSIFESCGKKLILGKGLILRKPGQIRMGHMVAIDDSCQLDGGGVTAGTAITLGDGSLISLGCVVQAKTNPIIMGEHCDIGAYTILTSIGGIVLGDSVLIAGNCYIGGGRYHLENPDIPIVKQGMYSRGPVIIGDGSWIGASVTILDGVTIGKGCVIGAGAVVTKDIPDYAVAVGSPAKVVRYREKSVSTGEETVER